MLADLPGTIVRLTNEIAVLDAQIATNPPNKTDLENQRAGKAAELRMAQNPALLTSARDKAVASLATAQGVLDTATATYNAAVLSLSTAQTSYQTAYANLVNGAGRYAIYNAGGSVIGHRCTTGCVSGDVNILGAFQGALDDLVGSAASSTPASMRSTSNPSRFRKSLMR